VVALRHNLQRIFFINGGCNKAEQLNSGVAKATGEIILFVHADSIFPDNLALRKGIDMLRRAESGSGGKAFAGHFRLRFERNSTAPSLGYTYFEQKARLDRPGCAHGDQGIMLSQKLFAECGPFAVACPLLSETRFADQLREKGQWLLIPADILTSARRFEKEGLRKRQVLNGIIMALGATGMDYLLNRLPDIYREHGQVERLEIHPLLVRLNQEISALSSDERRRFWMRIGNYVSCNAWQILFFLDIRREFRADGGVGNKLSCGYLDRFDRVCRILACNKLGACCASVISRILFKLLLLRKSGSV
jgi:hypothetical protein